MADDLHVVSVEILGLRYPIRSALDPGYVTELAAYVDAKMQAAADETEPADSVRVAVLAALNIADELFRAREGDGIFAQAREDIDRRLAAIERLVDRLLDSGPEALAAPGRSD